MDIRQRIVEATYACVARWGLSKTTVEDAGREAGVSRATVYRYFPGGRDELITAVISWEFLQFFSRLYDEVRDAPSLEEVMERGLQFAHRSLAEHEVLQKVLQTEPDVLLPTLTVESTRILGVIASSSFHIWTSTAWPTGWIPREASDFLARMILSYMNAPGRWDLDDEVQVASWSAPSCSPGSSPVRSRAGRLADRSLTARQISTYCFIVGRNGKHLEVVRAGGGPAVGSRTRQAAAPAAVPDPPSPQRTRIVDGRRWPVWPGRA